MNRTDILAFAVVFVVLSVMFTTWPIVALVAGVGVIVFVSLSVRDARRDRIR